MISIFITFKEPDAVYPVSDNLYFLLD